MFRYNGVFLFAHLLGWMILLALQVALTFCSLPRGPPASHPPSPYLLLPAAFPYSAYFSLSLSLLRQDNPFKCNHSGCNKPNVKGRNCYHYKYGDFGSFCSAYCMCVCLCVCVCVCVWYIKRWHQVLLCFNFLKVYYAFIWIICFHLPGH